MFLTIKLCTYAKMNCLKYNICIKMDLALNNLQKFICHGAQINNEQTNLYVKI